MKEVALITLSCVLFVQMGLADSILRILRIKKISPCYKCLSYWLTGLWMGFHGYDPVLLVATSFIASYCSLWLGLLYDGLAVFYNYLYEKLSKTPDADSETGSPDAVSKM